MMKTKQDISERDKFTPLILQSARARVPSKATTEEIQDFLASKQRCATPYDTFAECCLTSILRYS